MVWNLEKEKELINKQSGKLQNKDILSSSSAFTYNKIEKW
jgi:hypothetical protein